MKKRWPIPRPTEHAALRACASAPSLPSSPSLFAGLVTAQALGDRHGQNLFAHAIVRLGGERGQ
ncbi:hypothetical protein [Streptomyces hokutonensis]|uniref:Uncharacterized protein n=1 Tax=Streptomyces hokutonensis TaxID=1306990 RepID=A0ABW6M7A6_9ACTN